MKQLPNTWSERKLSEGDHTLDHGSADALLDGLNAHTEEEALLIKKALRERGSGRGDGPGPRR